MTNFSVNVIGLKELSALLAKSADKLKETLAAGMRESAFIVEGKGKRQITSGKNRAIKTGYLRSSIGVASITPFQAKVIVGAHYGRYIHEGTRYMRARPFLADGLAESVPEIERIFGKRIKSLIEVT